VQIKIRLRIKLAEGFETPLAAPHPGEPVMD
jgi:hypothetical protein